MIVNSLCRDSQLVSPFLKALNNLQCTFMAYGRLTRESVYKVCDEPHPEKMYQLFDHCINGQTHDAFDLMDGLYSLGYSVDDLVGVMFKTAVAFGTFFPTKYRDHGP